MKKFISILALIPSLLFGQTTPTWQQTLVAGSTASVTKAVALSTTLTYSLAVTGNYTFRMNTNKFVHTVTGAEGHSLISALGNYSLTVTGDDVINATGDIVRGCDDYRLTPAGGYTLTTGGDQKNFVGLGAVYSVGTTYSVTSGGLHTIGSPSLTISSPTLRFSGAGTPGAGKFLQSDASGYATWQTVATGITVGSTAISSGTSGAIPFNGAGVYQEDATKLFWDNAADALIVGSNALLFGGEKLFVNGKTSIDIGGVDFRVVSSSVADLLGVYPTYTRMGKPLIVNGTGFFAGGELFMVNSGSTSSYMNIGSSGNVGLGLESNAVTAKLHVKGTGATSASSAFRVWNNSSTLLFHVRDDGYISVGDPTNYNITIGIGSKYNPALLGNTFVGANIGEFSTPSGNYNACFGLSAGHDLTSGSSNVFVGRLAGSAVTTGSNNVLVGAGAGSSAGDNRVFVGANAGNINTNTCIAIGYGALGGTGATNTIIGNNSFGAYNNSGADNSTLGEATLQRLNSGSRNVSIGSGAGAYVFLAASDNTYVGNLAGQLNNDLGTTSGTLAKSGNTFLGSSAGQTSTGNYGTAVGYKAGQYETADNHLFLSAGAVSGITNTTTARDSTLIHGEGGVLSQRYVEISGAMQINSKQHAVNNSVSGTTTFSQPQAGSSFKLVVIYLSAAIGTATYTYPVAFTNTPSIVASSDVAIGIITTLSNTAVTVTGTTTTGTITLIGY